MNIRIREANKADLQSIKKPLLETGWTWNVPEKDKKELDKEEWGAYMLEIFEKNYGKLNDKIFVAEGRGSILGYVWVGERSNLMTGKKHGFIFDIFVEEQFRGEGIGKMLLQEAESYCLERNYPRILLMVSQDNQSAIRLYTNMNYKTMQVYMGKELS